MEWGIRQQRISQHNARQAALKKLGRWLERTDLSSVDVLHFGEEHPYNAAAWLDPLYDAAKAADPNLPVYVWSSYPLGPSDRSDGHVYDAYGLGYTSFRRKAMTFLGTGKPLIMCVDGSGYSDLIASREQVMVCREFDIPVFYFVAENGWGGYGGWYAKPTAILAPCRNFVFSAMEFQRRSRAEEPIAAGDMIWGDMIELSGDEDGRIDFAWTGLGRATVYGFQRLKIDRGDVSLKDDREAALDYQFGSLLPVRDGQLVLKTHLTSPEQSAAGIRVARSRCGKSDTWQELSGTYEGGFLSYEVGEMGRECRLRISLIGQDKAANRAVLRGCRLTGSVTAPPDRAIDLDAHYDGWRHKVRFGQDMGAGSWRLLGRVDHAESLEPGLALAMRGAAGFVRSATVVERFRSAHRLKDIVIRLTGYSHSALGGSFSVGVSLDGKEVLSQGVRGGQPRNDGYYEGTHTIDLTDIPELQGVKEFYVLLTQLNGSGHHGNVSTRLNRLEIDATIKGEK